jgi:hypothetical protein
MAEPDEPVEDELELEPPKDPIEEAEDDESPDDHEAEADEGEEQDQPDQPIAAETEPQGERQERRPSRGENRFQRQQNENVRLNGELAAANRRLDDLSRQMAEARKPAVESPEQRQARFALMTPQEQMQETLRESEQRFSSQMSQMQMQMAEQNDRTQYQTQARVDPLYAKWGPRVEGKLAEMRANGQNAPRDVVLRYLIGEAALERRGSKAGKAEVAQAQNRVRAARTRPGNAGSDTQSTRRSSEASLERRLENVQI